jgi:gag-polyprotein putative aspartyl protease
MILPKEIVSFHAIWDTGATATAISKKVVDNLALIPISFTKVGTGGGEVIAPVHLVNIILPNNVIIQNIQVTQLDELNSCDILIGMDIISQGDFALTHFNGKACFSFRTPPSVHIDFVPESNLHNIRLKTGRLNSKTGHKRKK